MGGCGHSLAVTRRAAFMAAPSKRRVAATSSAMEDSRHRLVWGDPLSKASRAHLTAWLVAAEVGGPLLRVGIPGDWRIAVRTWAPELAPLIAVIYLTETDAAMEERNAAIAAIGEAIAAAVAAAP